MRSTTFTAGSVWVIRPAGDRLRSAAPGDSDTYDSPRRPAVEIDAMVSVGQHQRRIDGHLDLRVVVGQPDLAHLPTVTPASLTGARTLRSPTFEKRAADGVGVARA